MKPGINEKNGKPEASRPKVRIMAILLALFVILASLPILVPHTGLLSLFCLVPLLCMEHIGTENGVKRMWLWHYSAFVLWNAATTFWVCNATVSGGIFAVLANAFQMSLIFGTFRWSRRVLKGILPYIFLAFLWIAWEHWYLTSAQISWPWLVLGNSFARTASLVQWYEFTGALGGSLWIWSCNLGLFGLMMWAATGKIAQAGRVALVSLPLKYILLLTALPVYSLLRYKAKDTEPDSTLDVIVLQPNIDPYHKFEFLTQSEQNDIQLSQTDSVISQRKADSTSAPLLVIAPETFTRAITVGNYAGSRTWNRFTSYLKNYPNVNLLFGASTYEFIHSALPPSSTARKYGQGTWYESRNSALMVDGTARTEIFHKSKLVVAVEKTPYPALFCKIDDMLGGVMGRCIGQDEISLLNVRYRSPENGSVESNPVGCAVCYESIYGEYYTDYIRKGAEAMTVITNDAWWGNTPGYRQHLSYSSLRAIETRRAIARCANTGISAIISPSGEIVKETSWWKKEVLTGAIPLRNDITFFVSHGDITGRVCTFLFLMLLLALVVRFRKP